MSGNPFILNCNLKFRLHPIFLLDHDNREATEKQKFRPNFKSGRIVRNRTRQADPSRLQRIVEQDVDMAGTSSHTDSNLRQ